MDDNSSLTGGPLNRSGFGYSFSYSDDRFIPPPLTHGLVITFIVLYILIILLALLGNLIVIAVIFFAKMIRPVTDMFIVSLAVSDLLICVLNMPFQLLFIVTNEWTMGLFLCKFCNYIQGVTIVSNILTLMAIAIDRYLVICHTEFSRRFHTKRVGWVVLAVVWCVSLLIVCPQLLVQRLDKRLKIDANNNILRFGYLCVESHKQHNRKTYSITIYACVYLLPVCVMAYTYGAIAYRLWVRLPIGDMLENPRNYARNTQQKKRLTQMLMLLVVAFTVLWFPFFTAALVQEVTPSQQSFRVKMAVLQLIGYSNCCVNPIIYTFLNKKFQVEFRRIFRLRRMVVVHVQRTRVTPQNQTSDQSAKTIQHM